MPYFKNNKMNLLLIHIPKTGCTSLEYYFSMKSNIVLNPVSLFFSMPNTNYFKGVKFNSSFQHLTYNTIMKHKVLFNIDETNLQILTVVRNPYDRIISDLFFFKKIKTNSSPEEVHDVIKAYLHENDVLDNHVLPQHKFITDESGNLVKNVIIARTETLQKDMIKLGYTDFHIKANINICKDAKPYSEYLNNDSIKLINEYYNKDFTLFNYDKKVFLESNLNVKINM